MKNNVSLFSDSTKNITAGFANNIHTGEKVFCTTVTFEGL